MPESLTFSRSYGKNDIDRQNATLHLKYPEKYFNAGMVVFYPGNIDAAAFNAEVSDTLAHRNLPMLDQDCLNIILNTRVRMLDIRYNLTVHTWPKLPPLIGDLVREFRFVNDGTAPLVLVRVITSCSCLKASFSKRPVEPADSGVIRITYEPHKSEPGAFNKVIQVYSNSVDGRDVITVQGNSIEGQPRGKVKTEKVKVKYK